MACLAMSPDRARLGGVAVSTQEGREGPVMQFWCYEPSRDRDASSDAVRLDDYCFGGMPWVFWSADGRCLYANGDLGGTQKEPFPILKYEPFPRLETATEEELKSIRVWIGQLGDKDWKVRDSAMESLKKAGRKAREPLAKAGESSDAEVASRAKSLLAGLEAVQLIRKDASLLAACELAPGMLGVVNRQRNKAFWLNVETDNTVEYSPSLLLVDRKGFVGLFMGQRALMVAKVMAD